MNLSHMAIIGFQALILATAQILGIESKKSLTDSRFENAKPRTHGQYVLKMY
jgi:hypothetical protein